LQDFHQPLHGLIRWLKEFLQPPKDANQSLRGFHQPFTGFIQRLLGFHQSLREANQSLPDVWQWLKDAIFAKKPHFSLFSTNSQLSTPNS